MKFHILVLLSALISLWACGPSKSPLAKEPSVDSSDQEGDAAYEGAALVLTKTPVRQGPFLSSPSYQVDASPVQLAQGEGLLVRTTSYDAESGLTFAQIGFGWVDVAALEFRSSCHKRFVGPYSRAFEDSYLSSILSLISLAEGTGSCYHYMFGYKTFTSYEAHPNQCQAFGNTCSTAAGRFQFLKKTWDMAQTKLKAPSFEPKYQDLGAHYLIEARGFLNAGERLNATQFRVGMTQISWEWASLPPGQYGQPARNLEYLWRRYQEWTQAF